MKIKKGYKLKTVSGRQTVVADRRIIKNFNSVIILNDSAIFLWNLLYEADTTREEMLEKLTENSKMSRPSALSNIDVFVKIMKENGIIEE